MPRNPGLNDGILSGFNPGLNGAAGFLTASPGYLRSTSVSPPSPLRFPSVPETEGGWRKNEGEAEAGWCSLLEGSADCLEIGQAGWRFGEFGLGSAGCLYPQKKEAPAFQQVPRGIWLF